MVLNGPSNLVPVLRPKPGTNESPGAELSKMVIQQVLDQVIPDCVRVSSDFEVPRAEQGALLTFRGTLGIFFIIMAAWVGYAEEPFYCLPNLI